MGKFENQLSRMQSLMTYGMTNESEDKSGNIEFTKVASDGRAYGIIRECNRFYIKVADADKKNLVEAYNYIGGFNNKRDYEYKSYQNALKNFDMKMMSINEATGIHGNATSLDPSKKGDFVIEGTNEMKKELARQRQIMENASRIGLYEDEVRVNKDPERVNGSNNENQPYTEKGVASLDKDPKQASNNPEKQGNPYGEGKSAEKGEQVKDKNIPSDGKSVAVNECGDMCKGCGKPKSKCTCKECCNEEENKIGQEMFNDGLTGAHEMSKTETNKPYEQPVNEEMREWDKGLPGSAGVGTPDTDHNNDPYKENPINEAEGEDEPEASVDDEEGEVIDAEDGEDVEGDGEIDLGADGEPEGAELTSDDLASDEGEEANGGDLEERISELEAELAELKGLLSSMDDEEPVDAEPVDAEPIDDVPVDEPESEVEPVAEPSDDEFDDGEEYDDEYDDEYEDEDYFPDELDENKKAFMNHIVESVTRSIVKEERTELHDFGKHPGYRKKPMTLPPTGSDEYKGNKDWNDDSVHNEKPFGSSIGDGKPYSELVKVITDSVISELKKKM